MSQSEAAASLLSLSIAAASAPPIPLHHRSTSSDGLLESGAALGATPVQASSSMGSQQRTHRRLASTGRTRRRLSDAREAAARPSPAMLHASLADLDLSTSPHGPAQPLGDGSNFNHNPPAPIPIGSKKRGVEHKCESCSKIYRHPSCLIKHRWEHTPHWREASKFVLSKHQQVQLLEAAAILSHLSPTSSSLPEDRSLWPSFLSGGSLPPPDPSTLMSTPESKRNVSAVTTTTTGAVGATAAAAPTVSSSVPVTPITYSRSSSTGPRMHDYSIPTKSNSTQVRPGLLGVSTSSTTINNSNISQVQPMSVPLTTSLSSHSWSSLSVSNADSIFSTGTTGGWSLPRSSVRSVSGSSRSRSGSASDDEQEGENDIEVGDDDSIIDDEVGSYGRRPGRRGASAATNGYGAVSHHRTRQPKFWKREDDDLGNIGAWSLREEDEYLGSKEGKRGKEWDGMEMEMDMD